MTPLSLADYVQILRRRRWVVVIVVVAAVAVSFGFSLTQDRVYAASTTVRVRDATPVFYRPEAPSANYDSPERRLNNEAALLLSPDFQRQVFDGLDGAPSAPVSSIDADVVSGADLIVITVRSRSPEVAQTVANKYAEIFLEVRRDRDGSALADQSAELRTRAREKEQELATVDAELRAAEAAGQPVETLRAQRESLSAQYLEFIASADELDVNRAYIDSGSGVITRAELPTVPVSPNSRRNMVAALGLGLLAGLGLALLVDVLDDRLKTLAEIRRAIPNVPLLATVPKIASLGSGVPTHIPVVEYPMGVAAEAFRSLRTSLLVAALDDDLRVLMVTSPMPGEGKTTVAANLAVTFAERDRRVLLVDCDARRPALHEALGVSIGGTPGVSGVLAGDVPLSQALIEVALPNGNRIWLLPLGPALTDPAELLSSPRLDQLMGSLRDSFDLVVLDTTPVVPVADALPLVRCADDVVLVVKYQGTRRHQLARTLEVLGRLNPAHISVVVNAVPHDGYENGHYFRDADDGSRRRFVRRLVSQGQRNGRPTEKPPAAQPAPVGPANSTP